MVDSRSDAPGERESAELAPGARNHSENGSDDDDPAQRITPAKSQDAGPAVRAGSHSERKLRVPTREAGKAGEAGPRKAALGDIMTRTEVAALLRCSEPHVVALVEREQLPGFRLGRPWRFRRSEVLAWCERRINGRRSA